MAQVGQVTFFTGDSPKDGTGQQAAEIPTNGN